MTGSKTTLLLATLLTAAMSWPLAAQTGGSTSPAAPPGTPRAAAEIPDATVQKTGAALRQVANIQEEFSQRIQTAPAPEQRQQLVDQANRSIIQAITGQGLSVDEYNRVIQLAQADPNLRQRVLAAAQAAR